MVETHVAQDYPLEQFKTVLTFSVTKTKYMSLILMVNLAPGMYHGNKNCETATLIKMLFQVISNFYIIW